MRLVDFLIALLEAHAETLKRLAALFGEERLLEILEASGDDDLGTDPTKRRGPVVTRLQPKDLESAPGASGSSTYQELEGAVHDFGLPAVLEFHLWAYPHYRAFIESPLELSSRIPGPGGETGTALVEEAVAQAQAWVRSLHIPPQIGIQAERAAHVPWLRFRTNVLKRIGKRPLGPVY